VGAAAAAVVAPAIGPKAPPPVKALVFDTSAPWSTARLDHRGGMALGKTKGIAVDLARFEDRWRDGLPSGNGEGSQGASSRGQAR